MPQAVTLTTDSNNWQHDHEWLLTTDRKDMSMGDNCSMAHEADELMQSCSYWFEGALLVSAGGGELM